MFGFQIAGFGMPLPTVGGGGSSLPVLESFTTAAAANTSGLVINTPSGTVAGEGLLLLVSCDTIGASTIDAATAGFSQVFFEQGGGSTSWDSLAAYIRIAGASEPSSYTITPSIAEDMTAILCRISGVNNSSPVDGYVVTNNGSASTTATSPNYTTTQDNCLVFRFANSRFNGSAADGNVSVTPTTEITRIKSQGGGNTNSGTSMGASHGDKATAGSVGTANFTLSTSSQWMAATVAIAPA